LPNAHAQKINTRTSYRSTPTFYGSPRRCIGTISRSLFASRHGPNQSLGRPKSGGESARTSAFMPGAGGPGFAAGFAGHRGYRLPVRRPSTRGHYGQGTRNRTTALDTALRP